MPSEYAMRITWQAKISIIFVVEKATRFLKISFDRAVSIVLKL